MYNRKFFFLLSFCEAKKKSIHSLTKLARPMFITRRLVSSLAIASLAAPPTRRAGAFDLALDVTFRADVNDDTCSELIKAVEQRVVQRAALLAQLQPEGTRVLPPIHLHVTSRGGSLIAGLRAYDYLSNVDQLHTHVDGIVASAATLLTLAGSHRLMTAHSMMLVHQPSIYLEDDLKATDLRDHAVNMKKLVSHLIEIYNATTLLTADDIAAMISNEQMMTASEALAYGFVNEIE